MKKFKVTVEKEIEVEFDETSPEFKELWEGYTSAIDSGADYQSFAENIASSIARYGTKDFIEGVGYVKHYNEKQLIFHNGKLDYQDGLVNVNVETDLNSQVDFDIDYTIEEQ